jgi:hypothetical protein
MCAGACCASWRTVSFPRPTLPTEKSVNAADSNAEEAYRQL